MSKIEMFALCSSHTLLKHSFETKIGFGFGLASYLKTKSESALRKHHISSNIRGCQSGTWSAGQEMTRGTYTKLHWHDVLG